MPEVLAPNEVYIASRSPRDGTLRREGKFKIVENTSVIETLEGLNPPTIAIGEQGRDTQPQASTITISDVTDGLGVRWNRQDVSDKRYYFSTLDTRYRRQITNLPKKTNRGTPPGITATTSLPGAGGVYNNRVYVAWGAFLRSHIDTSGGSVNVASSTNAAPIAVTTAVSHGYVTGWMVTIAGHLVNTAANGTWTITVTGPTTFTLNGTTGNGVGVATGTVVSQNNGWTNGGYTTDHTFTGSSVPTGDPVQFADGWFWPLGTGGIDYLSPAGWRNVAIQAVGLLSLVDTLYAVTSDGVVSSAPLSTADVKITLGTLVPADFTTVVRIDDICSGMVAYTTSGTGTNIVPYVVGKRRLYEVDVAESSAMAAGPAQLPPNVWPMNVSPLATSNALYIAQGMGMLEWNNSIVVPKGLDNDDGVPMEYMGGIMKLVPGFENLFAIIFGTRVGGVVEYDIYGSGGDLDDGVMQGGAGTTWLATYEGEGWHTRAISGEIPQEETNVCLFLSDSEGTYRVWFALGPVVYSIDLEINVFNPLDNPDTQFELSGYFQSSHYDFQFLLEQKIGLMVQIEAVANGGTITPTLVLNESPLIPLYDADDNSVITVTGIHTFLVHADLVGPDYEDIPAVGRPFSTAAVRVDLAGSEGASPAVRAIIIHAIKANVPVRGWQVTLDLAQPHHDHLSAWQQRQLLLDILQDASHGLLHFGYLPDPDAPAGTAKLYPVMPTVVAFSSPTGTAFSHQTRVRLAFVEGYRLVPPEVTYG